MLFKHRVFFIFEFSDDFIVVHKLIIMLCVSSKSYSRDILDYRHLKFVDL